MDILAREFPFEGLEKGLNDGLLFRLMLLSEFIRLAVLVDSSLNVALGECGSVEDAMELCEESYRTGQLRWKRSNVLQRQQTITSYLDQEIMKEGILSCWKMGVTVFACIDRSHYFRSGKGKTIKEAIMDLFSRPVIDRFHAVRVFLQDLNVELAEDMPKEGEEAFWRKQYDITHKAYLRYKREGLFA